MYLPTKEAGLAESEKRVNRLRRFVEHLESGKKMVLPPDINRDPSHQYLASDHDQRGCRWRST